MMLKARTWTMTLAAMLIVIGMYNPAHAQFTPNYTTNIGTSMISSYYSPLAVMNRTDRTQLSRRSGRFSPRHTTTAGNRRSRTTATASNHTATNGRTDDAAPIMNGTTTFRPVAPMLIPQQLASEAKNPAERQGTEKFYAGLLNTYKQMMRQKGAPMNDVARAASFMAINSYYTYTGGRELTARQMDALREQFRIAYANDAGFQHLADRERQSNYESYAIIGTFLASAYESFKGAHQEGDAAKLQNLREIARKQLEATFGVPVDQISFTNNGVEYR